MLLDPSFVAPGLRDLFATALTGTHGRVAGHFLPHGRVWDCKRGQTHWVCLFLADPQDGGFSFKTAAKTGTLKKTKPQRTKQIEWGGVEYYKPNLSHKCRSIPLARIP